MQFISRVVVGRLEITADPWLDDLFPALVKHLEQHPPPPSAPAEEARLETDASSRLEHNNSSAPDSTVLDQPLEQLQLGNTDEQDGRGIASSSNRTVLRKGIDLKFKDRAELCKSEPNLILPSVGRVRGSGRFAAGRRLVRSGRGRPPHARRRTRSLVPRDTRWRQA